MSHAHPAPSIHVAEEGDCITARFVGLKSLTEENSDLLNREFAALADRKGTNVVLDFVAIDYLTSMVVSKLLVLDRQVRAANGQLTLVNLKPFVRQVFKIARLDQVLNIPVTALSA